MICYYAKVSNGVITEWPIYEGDIRLLYPNVSFPYPFVPPEGYVGVEDVPPPAINYTQNLVENTPILVSGVWTRSWSVVPASQQEIDDRIAGQWTLVRGQRDTLLQSCDWTQLPDVPLTADEKQEWVVYRQQLRDVTNQPDPFNIVWPVPPDTPTTPSA